MFESSYFQKKKVDFSKLLNYGFILENNIYTYTTQITKKQFQLIITIDTSGEVNTQVYDTKTGDEYCLYKVSSAIGDFVGEVKSSVETILEDISNKCFEVEVYKSKQAKQIIEYIRDKYNDELEFLWEKFSDTAISRRKDNKKWYITIMPLSKTKLGLESEEIAEIIDLRINPEESKQIVDNKIFFPGWHMNKKSWYTIILDGSVQTEELYKRIDESYLLAKK